MTQRKIEITEAQLIERERIKTLGSDEDVIAALNRFDHWVKKAGLNHYDAVSQMLLFLRQSIEAKTPLRDALFNRLDQSLQKMKDDPVDLDPRLRYAANYVVDAFRTDRYGVNYDPKFYYMCLVITFSDLNFEKHRQGHILFEFNGAFDLASQNKLGYIYRLAFPREATTEHKIAMAKKSKVEGIELFEVACLKGYYNISYHNNNINGRATWEEGEEIALGIYDFIAKPQSRGLLCSLLPSSGPISVDWSLNSWVYDVHMHGWINYKEPAEILSYFDQIAAMPNLFEK